MTSLRQAVFIQARFAAYARCSTTYHILAVSLWAIFAMVAPVVRAAEPPTFVTISAAHMVHMSDTTWSLDLDARGLLTVRFRGVDHKSKLPPERVLALRQQLQDADFFHLQNEYGGWEVHSDMRFIVVKTATQEKRVGVSSDIRGVKNMDEYHRALRACMAIRALFSIPGAADATADDIAFMER